MLLILLEIVQSSPVLEIDIIVQIVLGLMNLLFTARTSITIDVMVALYNDIWSTSTYEYLGRYTRVQLSHVLLYLISARCCVEIATLVVNSSILLRFLRSSSAI